MALRTNSAFSRTYAGGFVSRVSETTKRSAARVPGTDVCPSAADTSSS